VALLDQRAVAGIGNLYAAEILHIAALNPRKSCCRLTGRDWKVLAEATRLVLAQAVRYEGSTLADGTYRNALNVQGSYQNHHRVYARTGQPCKRCETGRIERFVQAQRATFWCPLCQRR
jgi:formamidopyrimidine-DNA glycosylase